MTLTNLQKKLNKKFNGAVKAREEEGCIILSGQLPQWSEVMRACRMAVAKNRRIHVVNAIVLENQVISPMRTPTLKDDSLGGATPDVLIIGGGISGTSILRELTKWELDVLLVDKESDLALHASGRNDGEVHPGVDLKKGTLKQKYALLGNKMYDKLCQDLDVPFERCGQYVGITHKNLLPFLRLFAWQRRVLCGVRDTRVITGAELRKREPNVNPDVAFALYNPSAACVCPYGLTIAYGENAIQNGGKISLNTAVLDMEVVDGQIKSVTTNRGILYPKLVINAAGVFAEDVATMAKDRFYSIHPRKGTNSILDKKAGKLVSSIITVKGLKKNHLNTKGGGILHTVHGNLLVGPDAKETYEKENVETDPSSIEAVFKKQKQALPCLESKDIITYFTGVRAATFEEDYIIEKGRKTLNLIHCAGIQSPGLTSAPAVALAVERMAVDELAKQGKVRPNPHFNPVRKGIPALREMTPEKRSALIKQNPDYGIIVCRCEEISKGEILDALKAPLCVPTLDGIKKRLRPGMGRCQGGFCSPLISKMIADYLDIPQEQVRKSSQGSVITYGETKGV